MKFTLVHVFNPAAYGLKGNHLAVLVDLPEDLGGACRVADMLLVEDDTEREDLVRGFERAASSLPYHRNKDGWQLEFLTEDRPGVVRHQGTMYVPDKPLVGGNFTDTLLNWMCWRARVYTWASSRDRVVLSPVEEARLLRSLEPAPLRVANAMCAQALLTQPAAPL